MYVQGFATAETALQSFYMSKCCLCVGFQAVNLGDILALNWTKVMVICCKQAKRALSLCAEKASFFADLDILVLKMSNISCWTAGKASFPVK